MRKNMKPILASTGLILTLCAIVFAQDATGDRIVVPARNTSHARVVNCNVMAGNITVKTYSGKEVIVEGPSARGPRTASNGMKRIGMDNRGLEVEEDDNVITIRERRSPVANLLVTVPVDTSLHLHTMSGTISVDGVHGEVEVHSQSGAITLTNISGTVTADSQNGPIKVGMNAVDATKPLSFSTFNGIVDLTLPPDLKADLTVKTNHGPVYSDFDVTLGGNRAVTEKNNSSDGRFRITIDNTIRGTINGGGVAMTIRTFNGGVYLHKKK